MNLRDIHKVYMLGIGGSGMSALAQYFNLTGIKVAGYDRIESPITTMLIKQGIDVNFIDDPGAIPETFRMPPETGECLVVYTPAIPSDNEQFMFFRNNGYDCFKRSQILGEISKEYNTIAVGGSHGKTTVSAMIAEVLRNSKLGCSAFLGGVSKNLGSNFIMNYESGWAVMEADEFDRSFLYLHPKMLVVTSMDPDHLDIYGDASNLKKSFTGFMDRLPENGIALVKEGLDDIVPPGKTLNVRFYGMESGRDYRAVNIQAYGIFYRFDLATPSGYIPDLITGVPGWLNVENAVAASSICCEAGVDEDSIRTGISGFRGIQRRFDLRISNDKITYIDDYAHHPKEISSFIESLRKLFPDKAITGIFQPHLFTRTKDFAREFGEELGKLDELILLDIYPAREKPIEGVSSELILDEVSLEKKRICKKDELIRVLDSEQREIVVTMGAGDIGLLVEQLENHFIGYAS